MTAVAAGALVVETDSFRLRLLDGLVASIGERVIAPPPSPTSSGTPAHPRTFYDRFTSKEQCFWNSC